MFLPPLSPYRRATASQPDLDGGLFSGFGSTDRMGMALQLKRSPVDRRAFDCDRMPP